MLTFENLCGGGKNSEMSAHHYECDCRADFQGIRPVQTGCVDERSNGSTIEAFMGYVGLFCGYQRLFCGSKGPSCGYVEPFCGFIGIFFRMYRALLRIHRTPLRIHRALLRIYRALLTYVVTVWKKLPVENGCVDDGPSGSTREGAGWGVVWISGMRYMSKDTNKYEKETYKRDL